MTEAIPTCERAGPRRSRSRIRTVGIVIFTALSGPLALILFAWAWMGFPASLMPQRGELYEEREVSLLASTFRVRAFREKTNWLPGGIFSLEYRRHGADEWHEITWDRHDDPIPIPHPVQIDDQLLYLCLFQRFVVTHDGGRSWLLWELEKDLDREHKEREYLYLISARMSKTGAGRLKIHSYIEENTLVLLTEDGGRTWRQGGYRKGYFPPGPSEEDGW